jgi:outer membrane protein OmpA-like peptidoglycan-associated protein
MKNIFRSMTKQYPYIISIFILGTIFIIGAQDELKDTPYFSGMPDYRITEAEDQDFAAYQFFNGKGCNTIEGSKYFRSYTLSDEAKRKSDLQISRNYANAVKNMGGTVIFQGECSGSDCAENCGYHMIIGKVVKEGNELWLEVVPFNAGGDYYLTVIVKSAMKQEVSAGDMLTALNTQGRIALYINFDTGKSTIKPESQPIIEQIVQMLTDNPDLMINIEGHTDNVGSPKLNMTLSQERAKSVMTEIIDQGIDATRLSAVGYGQDKPVADNTTEEGRAKNRRVELVKK